MGSYCLTSTVLHFARQKRVLWMDGGDACDNVNVLNATDVLMYTQKWLR